ncbi:MAG TPA: DUF302 domain-containing protein [Candidatus Tyrphobacter sp.]
MNISANPPTGSVAYGRVVSTPLGFEEAVERVRGALKAEGFGVLCDIDVSATMQEKLDVAFRPYRILGACNPPLAHRALEIEPQIGLLLPCNVVVQRIDGRTIVSTIDAALMMRTVGNPALEEIAVDANRRLKRVLDAIE